MYYAVVSKFQVPLVITFDENEAEFVCNSLYKALDDAYKIIDFFDFSHEYDDPFDEE